MKETRKFRDAKSGVDVSAYRSGGGISFIWTDGYGAMVAQLSMAAAQKFGWEVLRLAQEECLSGDSDEDESGGSDG